MQGCEGVALVPAFPRRERGGKTLPRDHADDQAAVKVVGPARVVPHVRQAVEEVMCELANDPQVGVGLVPVADCARAVLQETAVGRRPTYQDHEGGAQTRAIREHDGCVRT